MELITNILSSAIIIATPLTFLKILLQCKRKNNKLKIAIAIVIALILNIIVYEYTVGIYRSILGMIICIFVVYNIYNININKAIFAIVVCMILLMIPDFLFLCSCIYLFGFTKEYCYNVLAGSLLSNLIVYGSMIPLTIMLREPLRKLLDVKLDYNKKV